jgi:hypothetical protein
MDRPTSSEPSAIRNAFGRLLVDPGALTRQERVALLNRASGRLTADSDPEMRWLGTSIAAWLRSGGRLDAVLGVVPAQGSRSTPQSVMRQAECDTLLLRLSVVAGGDRAALAVLCGLAACPAGAADLVEQLHRLQAPNSRDAIRRARQRSARLRR